MTDAADGEEPWDGTDLPMVRLMTTISPTADLLMLDLSTGQAEALHDRARASADGDEPYTGVRFELSERDIGAVRDGLARLDENPVANTARVDLTDDNPAAVVVVVSVDPEGTAQLRDDLGSHAGDGDWVVQTQENALVFFITQLEAALDGADEPLRAAADELGLDYPD